MLKFIFKIFVLAICILAVNVDCGGKIKGEGNHTFYLYNKSSQAIIKTLPEKHSQYFFYFKNSLKGESVEFFSQEKALKLLDDLNASYVFSEEGDTFNCQYYFSDKIDDFVIINGNKINLHFSYNGEVFTVGTPFIFGSF
ncbi:MAG: hypothetical protein IKA99_06310 [Clostridia bacterium]|nr:hypothetical protein [Clostridia bacterium]